MSEKTLVIKFRKNDLNPSKGKQIEFNTNKIKDFFNFKSNELNVTFQYKSLNQSLNNKEIKVNLKLSPERGDYKIYQNNDGSPDVKDFLLQTLNLTENNVDDYFALKKINEKLYNFYYFPKTTTIEKIYELSKFKR